MSNKVDLKIVILGKSGIGKTCLIKRYVNGFYHPDEGPTVGASYFCKRATVRTQQVVMGIWDTAGQERFDSMTKIYYRGAEAAIVGYDITDGTSFERAKFWIEELNRNVDKCKIYLVGTKLDLVDGEEGRGILRSTIVDFANKIDASADIETSAKTGHEIDKLFQTIATNWLQDNPQQQNMYLQGNVHTNLTDNTQNNNNQNQCEC